MLGARPAGGNLLLPGCTLTSTASTVSTRLASLSCPALDRLYSPDRDEDASRIACLGELGCFCLTACCPDNSDTSRWYGEVSLKSPVSICLDQSRCPMRAILPFPDRGTNALCLFIRSISHAGCISGSCFMLGQVVCISNGNARVLLRPRQRTICLHSRPLPRNDRIEER